jgi:DNA-binding SARP family transcriptional activator
MELRILGPLEASDEAAPLTLGPPKQRALLARLAIDANRAVPLEQLLDDLWGDDLPDSAPKMAQIYVSQLRKVLPTGTIETRGRGYRLVLEGTSLDIERVERLRAEAREARARDEPEAAAGLLREALGLWRGPALSEFDEPFAHREAPRLEELRVACLEERIDADLAAGSHARVIVDLEGLIAANPLRERPREQLMLALYRSGRQAEALQVYQSFRRTLDEELGLEPSERLRDLEGAILRQEPALTVPTGPFRILRPAATALEEAPAVDAPAPMAPAIALPGRAQELAALGEALAAVDAGRRRMIYVTGEPGIGKSALVEAFLSTVSGVRIGWGQCVAEAGAGEPYLPLLDAIVDLASHPDGADVAGVLVDRAPTWLVQAPWLAEPSAREAAALRAQGATAPRILREALQALEALAAARPLVLVLEDLHWADEATLDVITALARRTHPARLMVIGTYRPGDVAVHTVARNLCGARLATAMPLGPLGPDAIEGALRDRFGAATVPPPLAGLVHERSGGNPLFAQLLVDHWLAEHVVVVEDGVVQLSGDAARLAVGLPPTIGASLREQLHTLAEEDLHVLEAASVVGAEFDAATVAAALELEPADVQRRCLALAHRGVCLEPRGRTFAFVHELHREALSDLVADDERARLHRRIGSHLEQSDGRHATRIALHLIEGGDSERAVRFLRLGAEQAFERRAYGIGIRHLRRALELIAEVEPGPTRSRTELELLTELGQAVVGVEGWSAPEAESALVRARLLAEGLGDNEPLLSILLALATLYELRGEFGRAEAAVEHCLRLAPEGPPGRRLEIHELLACNLFHQGAFVRALEHADRGASLLEEGSEAGSYSTFPSTLGDNAGVSCHDWAGLALWFLGRPDEALVRAQRALALAEDPSRSYSLATAQAQLAVLHQCRGEPEETLRWAEATVETAGAAGYAYRVAMGRVLRGWARVRTGEPEAGIDDLVNGLKASRATGAHMEDPHYLGLLADAYLQLGEPDAALTALSEALALARRERALSYEPELHRLRGVALRSCAAAAPGEAEAALRQAVEIARRQQSRSLELRAALSLAAYWAERQRTAEGRALVADAFAGMRDGFETPDLRTAAALLGR